MRNFETPEMKIIYFQEENIITASGNDAQTAAVTALTTEDSELLENREAVEEVLVFAF